MSVTPDCDEWDMAGNEFERPISIWGSSLAKPEFGDPDNPKDDRENQDALCAL